MLLPPTPLICSVGNSRDPAAKLDASMLRRGIVNLAVSSVKKGNGIYAGYVRAIHEESE